MKSTDKKRTVIDRDVLTMLGQLSLSMTLIWFINQLYSTVDLVVVGQLIGNRGTSAISTAGDFTNVMNMASTAIATGAGVYIAQLVGGHDSGYMRRALDTTMALLGIAAFIGMAYAFLFRESYLEGLNCPEEALADARRYLLITAAGLPFSFGYFGIVAILKAMGEGRNPLLYAVIASVLNIAGDLVLAGSFHMGVTGVAVATTFSQVVCFILALLYLLKKRALFQGDAEGGGRGPGLDAARRIMRMALPQLARIMLVQLSFLWIRSRINGYGITQASVYAIWYKLERLSNSVVFGVSEASGTVIGQLIGAKRHDQVRPVIRCTVIIGLIGALVPVALFTLFPRQIFRMFTANQAVIACAGHALMILSAGLLINAFGNGTKGISTGAAVSTLSLLVGVLDAGSRVLISMACHRFLGMGADSFYWGMAMAPLLPGLVCWLYLISDRWRFRKTLKEM